MGIQPLSYDRISSPLSLSSDCYFSNRTQRELLRSSLQSLDTQRDRRSGFCCLQRLWKLFLSPFHRAYRWFFPAVLEDPLEPIYSNPIEYAISGPHIAKFPECIAEDSFDPHAFAHTIEHPLKLAVYQALVQGRSLGGPIPFYKIALRDRSYIKACPLFQMSDNSSIRIVCKNGTIPQEASSTNTAHWQVNFADPHVMGFSDGPLMAQDEEQVLMHPPLSHIKSAFHQKGHGFMKENEIYLLKNVLCFGKLDREPLANGSPLYGNHFAQASTTDVLSHLHVQNAPRSSNIVFMAAPRIDIALAGKPYQKNHLEHLFYTAFSGFWGVKHHSLPSKSCLIHTGNWGAGAFGNCAKASHLLQIAAAHAAGVDTFFYPLDQAPTFYYAEMLFNQIKVQHPDMSVDQFLEHLAEHAQEYDLLYGQTNGT